MNNSISRLKDILDNPSVGKFISGEERDKINAYLSRENVPDLKKESIYVKIALFIGAWFSVGALGSIIGMTGLFSEFSARVAGGACFMIVAILLSRFFKSTFTSQLALILAILGNCLIISVPYSLDSMLYRILLHAGVCVLVYPFFKSNIYRFLAPIALLEMILFYFLEYKIFDIINIMIMIEVLIFGIFLVARRLPEMLTPLRYSFCCIVFLTTAYVWMLQFSYLFYHGEAKISLLPSSIFISFALAFFILHSYREAGYPSKYRNHIILAIFCVLILSLFVTPVVIFSIWLLVAGYFYCDKAFTSLACIFLPASLFQYYYSMEIDLNYKALAIGGSGLLLLIAFFVIKFSKPETREIAE